MIKLKKILAGFISLIISLSIFAINPVNDISVLATQQKYDNFSTNYSLTGDGATDMLAVAFAQYHRTKAQFGYSEAWCADFVCDCAYLAGQTDAIPLCGAVSHEYQNVNGEKWYGLLQLVLRAGGVKVNSPRPGDLVFWKNSSISHVEIVSKVENDEAYSIGGNNTIRYADGTTANGCAGERKCTSINSNILCYVRPNYKGNSSKPSTNLKVSPGNMSTETVLWWDSVDGATGYDLKIWRGVLWEGDPYLVEWNAGNTVSSIFESGTYYAYVDTRYGDEFVMSNVVEFTVGKGSKLEVIPGNTSTETKFIWNKVNEVTEYNVKVWKDKLWKGDPYLVWWNALNPFSATFEEGKYYAYVDSVISGEIHMSNVVEFNIEKGCKLDVVPGNTSTETKFIWNKINGVSEYDVKVWKDELWKGNAYLIEWNATNPFSVNFEEGKYFAYIDGRENDNIYMSNVVEFDVKKGEVIKKGDVNADGIVSVSDVLMLQKYFLNEKTDLKNRNAADIDENGVVNIVDMCLIKKLIIKR